MSPDELDAAWHAYKDTADPAIRERLILHYRYLIDVVVRRYAPSNAPTLVDRGDLTGWGVFGLMDAIEKFEPERGLKFETYAMARIRGAIVDEVRSYDWVPRSVRSRAEELRRAWAKVEHREGRYPTERELADELGWTAQELHRVRAQMSRAIMESFDQRGGDFTQRHDDNWYMVEPTSSDQHADPAGSYEIEELRERVIAALCALPDREQVLMVLYYGEGLTGAEIGTILGVTESRVVQIHTATMLALSESLR